MSKIITSEAEFEKEYSTQINHIVRDNTPSNVADEDICSFGGKMYETYDEELEYVKEMAKQNRVVTIVEGEDEVGEDGEEHSVIYYASGLHLVNRIGYLIVDKPIDVEFDIKLDW